MRRVLLLLLIILPVAGRAEAVTIRDIIELSKAGLGEEVLLALIEVTQDIYTIDNPTITGLKEAGVGEKVIVAMIRSGRANRQESFPVDVPRATAPAHQQPAPVHLEQRNEQTQTVEVSVPVPVYVPFIVWPRRLADDNRPHKPAEPQYWGFGGKLRPDAWKPNPTDEKPKPPPCVPTSSLPRCQP